ncbi:MAG: SIR2 family protein, partial [Allobaculum sp.]|nr:SIR2 family protein [Allobaculum sp.]
MEDNKEFQAQQKGLLKVIHFLREKADRGKLIVFVGAGVSCNVEGMPSWNKLVNKMADTLEGNEDKETTLEDERTFSIDDSLKFPQYLWNEDSEEYKNILNNSIPDLEVDPPLSSAIFDLNPTHIITTNYDHLLEKSSNPLRTLYQVIIRDKDLLTYTHSKYLIKMHGDIDDFDSIVLKEDDYLNYSSTHNLIEWFVRSLFTNHVVLFLGYSLNDSNVRQIVSWINLIRSENQITHKDSQPIGYLVQDEETIDRLDRLKLNDFARKNIEIINIHSISSISDIPKELKDERGKR